MVQAVVKMHNLQELIRKINLSGLINSAVIIFSKDNRMKIEAIGFEDEQGIVDATVTADVNYPCESVTEEGTIALNFLNDEKRMDLLPKLELFERDDIVQISTTKNELIVSRASPAQTLTYELASIEFVKSYSAGLKTIFGAPIRLVIKADGKEKLIAFDTTIVVDGQKLKEHGSKISKINAESVPLSAMNGKVITDLKGATSGLIREVEGVTSVTGNAKSTYVKEILTIFAHAIGTATLRMSEGSPIHIHYEHESMTADYLLQVYDGN